MLTSAQVISYLSGKDKIPEEIKKKIDLWRGVYYRMSLHIDGACPWFYNMRWNDSLGFFEMTRKRTYPNNYFGQPYQDLFENYLLATHPKESIETRNWRYSQYRPFTQDPFLKVIDVIKGAIFQDSGYVIKIEDKEDAAYIDGNNFHGKNLVDYMSSKFGNVASDPSGFFLFKPAKRRDEYTVSEKVSIDISYVFSKDISYISDDEIVFWQDGYHWHVNKIGYFRYRKDAQGNFQLEDSETGGYYAHMLNRLPIIQGGGKWNAQGFYDSWLLAARAFADEYVSGKSAEQLVNKEASYPYIIEANTECPDCNGRQTTEIPCDHDHSGNHCDTCGVRGIYLVQCGTCNGSGRMSRNPGERLIATPEMMDKDLVKIVNPSIDINKFHAENNKEIFKGMLEALHLNYIDQAQSGVAKVIDQETRHQFLVSISKDWFNRIIFEAIWITLSMRNATVAGEEIVPDMTQSFTVIEPYEFQIKTSNDLAAEYKLACESGLPSYVREAINKSFVDKQFGGDAVMKRKAELIGLFDYLSVCTPEEVQIWAINGAAQPRDIKYHVVLPNLLDNVINEVTPDVFMSATNDAIKQRVDAKFNAMSPATPPIQSNTFTETRIEA